ncbi:MAG: hypothetical protein JNM43_28940 [Planctomycetaceae bacterium]|nr:hypothetical protein [Planctomycetaceae bacterium]
MHVPRKDADDLLSAFPAVSQPERFQNTGHYQESIVHIVQNLPFGIRDTEKRVIHRDANRGDPSIVFVETIFHNPPHASPVFRHPRAGTDR